MCSYSTILAFVRTLGYTVSTQSYLSTVSYRTLIRGCGGAQLQPLTWTRYVEWLLVEGLAYRYDPSIGYRARLERSVSDWIGSEDGDPILAPGYRLLAIPSHYDQSCLIVYERALSVGLYMVERARVVELPGCRGAREQLDAVSALLKSEYRAQASSEALAYL